MPNASPQIVYIESIGFPTAMRTVTTQADGYISPTLAGHLPLSLADLVVVA